MILKMFEFKILHLLAVDFQQVFESVFKPLNVVLMLENLCDYIK